MRWPTDLVLISQGVRAGHMALDFAAGYGVPVRAPVTGTVVGLGTNPNYQGDLYVVIREDHPDGWEYYTGHHSRILVRIPDRVQEGQEIAWIGSTGQATGPHTHFQVRRRGGGELLNPHDVFNARAGQEKPTVDKTQAINGIVSTAYRVATGVDPTAKQAGYWIDRISQNQDSVWELIGTLREAHILKLQRELEAAKANNLRDPLNRIADALEANNKK